MGGIISILSKDRMGGIISPQSKKIKREGTRHHPEEILPQSKKIKREGTRHHPEEVITEEILPQSKKIKREGTRHLPEEILPQREGTRHLPEEIITEEILPRLPVKSLLKFRCVSKKIKREGTRHHPEGVITEETLPQSKKIKREGTRHLPEEIREGTRHLPEEIITEEILPRLPVKSLLKFRCVAKSWCSLIESKRFVKAHLENSIKSSRSAHDPIPFYNAEEVYIPSLFEPDRECFNAGRSIVMGCCNGLCLLLVKKRFILWNPATRKFHNLPDFPKKPKSLTRVLMFGLGFDELNDDYKVFALVWDVNAPGDSYSIIYCLRSNLWKVIQKIVFSADAFVSTDDFVSLYLNGKLHWYKLACEIIWFDLNSYEDGVVQLPIDPKGCSIRLGVVGGCLSAHYFHEVNFVLDVWILKEYGVKESWDKVAIVPFYNLPTGPRIPTPIAIDPNGDIFLIYGSVRSVVIYNTKSNEFRHPNIPCRDLEREMNIYIESLVSVAPDAEQES